MTSETNQQLESRLRLIDRIYPALNYLQRRVALGEFQTIDLELARRLYLERITGLREDGQLSVFFGTLQEGSAPSIARLQQLLRDIDAVIEEIVENADQLGVTVVTGTREIES